MPLHRTLFLGITFILASLSLPAAELENEVRLALLRAVPEKWNLEKNFSIFEKAVLKAAESKARLFITPECWLDGYASPDPGSSVERLLTISQDLDSSPYLKSVSELAKTHHMWICFGFTSLENGQPHNAAGLWNDEGELMGVYHKTHLQRHDLQYAAGQGLPVFESPWGKLGILICADRRWPESSRVLRLKGARMILNPTYGFWNDLNEAMIRTRSYENELYFAFTHPQQSLVTGTKGEIIANEKGPDDGSWEILITDLDLGFVDDHGHVADRRPDIYNEISESSKE